YILHQSIPLWGTLNIFDLIGLVVAAILTVNALEVYIKYRVKPFGRVAADVLLTAFLLIVASDLTEYMFGKIGTYPLLFNLMIYTVLGLITLFILGILRNRYGKVKGRGKPRPKGTGI
ncbi:MAG: DUF373 family protein, partial [Vulcanisaeta sp.]